MKTLPLKPYRQSPDHCGPACLKMIFAYFGIHVSESEIAQCAGTIMEIGTSPKKMVKAARAYGFQAFYREMQTLKTIERFLKKRIPVIVSWFSHDDGHYSVVVGLDEKSIILLDPETGRKRTMPLEQFVYLWFDFPWRGLRKQSDIRIRPIIVVQPILK